MVDLVLLQIQKVSQISFLLLLPSSHNPVNEQLLYCLLTLLPSSSNPVNERLLQCLAGGPCFLMASKCSSVEFFYVTAKFK